MNRFDKSMAYALRFERAIRRTLGELLIETAPLMLDLHEATDFILPGYDLRIGARVRSPGFLQKYLDQFTIRDPSEINKILAGYCDLMLYAHACPSGAPELAAWMAIDMDAFRHHVRPDGLGIYYKDGTNTDGTMFRAYDVNHFLQAGPPSILIARSQNLAAVT